MKKRLSQLSMLSLDEWTLLITSLIILPVIALGLRFYGLKKTRSTLVLFIPDNTGLIFSEDEAMRGVYKVARIVDVASRHGLYFANCLKESLILWWLLTRKGIKSKIHIGVEKDSVELLAHAWVEYLGAPLNNPEQVQQHYSVFKANW